jgi:hypothetical protein
MRPYARADSASNGRGSNVASARWRRSWCRARSSARELACGPAASSAIVTALTAISMGNEPVSTRSRSITTDVSIRPRGWRDASATRRRFLVDDSVEVVNHSDVIDSRSTAERGHNRRRIDEAVPPQRN